MRIVTSRALVGAQILLIVAALGWLALLQAAGGTLLLTPLNQRIDMAALIQLARTYDARLVSTGRSGHSLVVTGANEGLLGAALAQGILPLPTGNAGCGEG